MFSGMPKRAAAFHALTVVARSLLAEACYRAAGIGKWRMMSDLIVSLKQAMEICDV